LTFTKNDFETDALALTCRAARRVAAVILLSKKNSTACPTTGATLGVTGEKDKSEKQD
jgi:hypothetical protein